MECVVEKKLGRCEPCKTGEGFRFGMFFKLTSLSDSETNDISSTFKNFCLVG